MITTINDVNICGPINIKHDINNLLFRDINYTSEKLEDGFISRNVNFYENNKPTFVEIINDCKEREIYEGDRFKDIILDKKDKGEDQEEETIDKLIKNMENKIKSIDDKIINTYKSSTLLEQTLPEDYKQRKIDPKDKEILDKLNKILEKFSENQYTKDNL
jgi:hypothetical protein